MLAILGRTPTLTELGIFSVMWSEHCSYKSSRVWLKQLPTKAPWVIHGPGENAGVVDIGDGLAAVFKMESHNHPSFIEPYQGAATGVGGILRDVFTMGARPIANLNALRFGQPETSAHEARRRRRGARHRRLRQLRRRAHRGRRGQFPPRLRRQPAGQRHDRRHRAARTASSCPPPPASAIRWSMSAPRPAATASMAPPWPPPSSPPTAEEKRPTVQIGDPFTEKLLIEACLELMATDAIVAIQDMGAAGLTSSSVEMAGKGGVGIELDLDQVPQRETGMTAYEMMLSESQERMLMVLRPDRERRGARHLREMGAGFRRHRPPDRHRPHRRPPQRRGRGRHPAGAAGRPGATLPPPDRRDAEAARSSIRPRIEDRVGLTARAAEAGRLPRPLLARLDLGPVRQHRRRPDGQAPRRRGCRRGQAGGPDARAGADHRLHARATARRPGGRRRARRWPRPGATSPRSARGRWRSPTT